MLRVRFPGFLPLALHKSYIQRNSQVCFRFKMGIRIHTNLTTEKKRLQAFSLIFNNIKPDRHERVVFSCHIWVLGPFLLYYLLFIVNICYVTVLTPFLASIRPMSLSIYAKNLKNWYIQMPYSTFLGDVTISCNRADSALTPMNTELVSVSAIFRRFFCPFCPLLLHIFPEQTGFKY